LLSEKNINGLGIYLKLFTISIIKGKNTSAEARIFQRIVKIPKSNTKWQFAKFAFTNLKSSYSADYQDLVAMFFTSHTPIELTFLELGAVDGIYKSNCALLEKSGWVGIAVEANPIFSDDFYKNRKCEFINKGVVTQSQIISGMLLEFCPGAVTAGKLIASKSKTKSNQETIGVDLISVRQLISHWESRFGDAPPTYLSVDIEGLDLPVVREMLTSGFKPTLISMEHNFRTGELDEINSIAKEFGYIEIYANLCRNGVILTLTAARFPRISTELLNVGE